MMYSSKLGVYFMGRKKTVNKAETVPLVCWIGIQFCGRGKTLLSIPPPFIFLVQSQNRFRNPSNGFIR